MHRALALACLALPALGSGATPMTEELAGRFAALALACVHREYPNKISHMMLSDADVAPARLLTPAFYGCLDWHSAVHGHWLLARLARLYPEAPFAAAARSALATSLTPAKIAQEARYVSGGGRSSFERPYGLAWLLQLSLELHEWNTPHARRWRQILVPLEAAVRESLARWLPQLSHPVRTGEHSQSAFALGLMLDWARGTGEAPFATLVEGRIRAFYLNDRNCPLAYEPGGEDFLSPCLAEADAVRRVLPPEEFARWFDAFLPDVRLLPERVTDPGDGKLAHLDGLNLSRAWMLEGIAAGLPQGHPRRTPLLRLAGAHRGPGLASVTSERYEGAHWLGSFATYLMTGRALPR
ncbi:MAG: DUF2891 domain-containing protein [Bryobacterales bacterium]|nr:DUF2891 domain-containing protein [Bryobacterales bacterium]